MILGCIGKVAEGAATDTCKTLTIDKVIEACRYIKHYKDNIEKVKLEYQNLKSEQTTVCKEIEQGKKNLQQTTSIADQWLDTALKLLEKDADLKLLINDNQRKEKDQCCFRLFDCNLYQRYKLSKSAKEKLDDIHAAIAKRTPLSEILKPISVQDLKPISTDSLLLKSREKLMKEIFDKLQDDEVQIVGIHGMGAIGKTTLMKEIMGDNRAKAMFDTRVMVEISEVPNVKRIQDQIAFQVGLSLDDAHDTDSRAQKLYNRLLLGKDGERPRKMLLILDNMWKKFDFNVVGIPKYHKNKFCKILITSRERNVCEVMGVSASNIFEVGLLKDDEASKLFKERIGDKCKSCNEAFEKRLLDKCGGLPLAIVALADVLKDIELSMWEQFADEMKKPTSYKASIRGVYSQAYSILETSYRLMESDDKRRFFFLTCLFPPGSSIPVEDMMRYGIGLGLFQHVNNLTEAIEAAKTWVDELKSSSLLLDDDIHKDCVKIHDVVRASTISFLEKGGDMYMVEAFPRWMYEESCEKYSAISLMSTADHSRLKGLKLEKLQILILDGSEPHEFADHTNDFFVGMTNLRVLVLKGMDFTKYGFPKSIRNLKGSLRTLVLEKCEMETVEGIGELKKLVVLSFRGSRVNRFPEEEMKKLSNLRLLDLGSYQGEIEADILVKMRYLEGFYARNHIVREGGILIQSLNIIMDKVSIIEFNKLEYLKVLEMKLYSYEQLPMVDDQFVKNLDQFRISICLYSKPETHEWLRDLLDSYQGDESNRMLEIGDENISKAIKVNRCLRTLLNKTENLILNEIIGLEQLSHELGSDHQLSVKYLEIWKCNDLIEWTLISSLFPHLELSYFRDLENLKIISAVNRRDIFSKLQCLCLENLPELQPYVLPIHLLPRNLTALSVLECPKLNFIFGDNDNVNQIAAAAAAAAASTSTYDLPFLKSLNLVYLHELESSMTTHNEHDSALFTTKLIFKSLEELRVIGCKRVVRLWDFRCKEKRYTCSFNKIKKMEIGGCDELQSLCPLSVAVALVNLKSLTIISCNKLTEVIHITDDDEFADQHTLLFPSLEVVHLERCTSLKNFITGNENHNHVTLEFPSLSYLLNWHCVEMQSFSSTHVKTPKLSAVNFNGSKFPVQLTQENGDINRYLKSQYQKKKSSEEKKQGKGEGEIEEIAN